jgi:hypothetical protein
MAKRVAIIQSNYIPWKGYFDMINMVDEFVLFDDTQYTRRDWRNRNKIKTAQGASWLTIPVEVKGKYFQAIKDTRVSENDWAEKHWRTIAHSYARAPHFKEYKDRVEAIYRSVADEPHLSLINHRFLKSLCELLGIGTRLSWSMEFQAAEGQTERLLSICKQAGATTYLSGPAAKSYLDESKFLAEGVAVEWMSYDGYPSYPQLHGEFDHGVTILDLIFNTGADAPRFMRSFIGDRAVASLA